jgi:hypothetical protein
MIASRFDVTKHEQYQWSIYVCVKRESVCVCGGGGIQLKKKKNLNRTCGGSGETIGTTLMKGWNLLELYLRYLTPA